MKKKKSLGQIIKETREKDGISQRELARRINVDSSLISKIEKDTYHKLNYKLLFNIYNNLNFEINFWEFLYNANYQIEEIEILIGGIDAYFQYKAKTKKEKYIKKDKINIIKILEDYKENKLDLEECLGLLAVALNKNIDLYLIEDEMKKRNLNEILKIK